jgi:predicted nucleic acid-binding protein
VSALLDTSVLAGRNSPEVDEPWSMSAVTVGELEAGVLLAGDGPERARRLQRLTGALACAPVLIVDHAVATRYAELRAASGRRPSNDLWIAATALAHDLTLLTADEQLAQTPLIRVRLITESR